MKKLFLTLIFCMLTALILVNYSGNIKFISTENKVYYNSNEELNLIPGTYTSNDGKTIIIDEASNIKFENTYSLSLTKTNRGSTITGKIGSDKKSATFYQLNDSTIMSDVSVTYKHNGTSTVLLENTIFKLTKTITTNESGKIELYDNDVLINKYNSLQDAVDSANNGNTIKLTDNLDVIGAAYINKNIIIDGNNKTLNYSTWTNGVFILEENTNLEIKNLTIDGGSKDFEVDYDSVTFNDYNIPLKNSATDIKQNLPAIISEGNLTINDLKIQNTYSTNGSALKITRGNATVNNSEFVHNRASIGGAVYLGSAFRTDQTEYSVSNVKFNKTQFKNNYSTSGGGAIYIIHTDTVEFDNCEFDSNTTTSSAGYGGAIYVNKNSVKVNGKTYNSTGHSKGLDFPQIIINDSIFDNNWAGNDGFAIQNYEAEFNIKNTIFKNNVGVSKSSSVATFSVYVMRDGTYAKQTIKNSIFEKNKGPVSCIGDHGTLTSFNISNTKFIENEGGRSIYFLTGVATFNKCEFIKDKSTASTIYALPCDYEEYYNGSGFNKPTIKIIDSSFENAFGNYDIVSATYDDDDYIKSEIIFEGTNTLNVDLTDANYLIVNGTHNGNIRLDRNTFVGTHLIYENNSETKGEIIDRKLVIYYKNLENKDTSLEIYIPEEQEITPYYVNQQLGIEKEGYLLYFYNEPEYSTKWDYQTTKNKTIYGNWEEHNHDLKVVVKDNIIIEKCECGKTGNKLYLQKPEVLNYDGKTKPVVVVNELGILEKDYNIVYSLKDNNGSWKTISGEPINNGIYKAKLTYNNLSIEVEYEILGGIDNPNTDNAANIYILLIIIITSSIGIILVNKKIIRFN